MGSETQRKRIWGWFFFDWASQPFYTVLLTFIFGPYFAAVAADSYMASGLNEKAADARATTIWSFTNTIAGILIALSAPILGAIADNTRSRMRWIISFSIIYLIGCAGLWLMVPDASFLWGGLALFGLAMIGAEFTTIFTNALLPSLGSKDDIGRISGWGYAMGYFGGIFSLFILLLLFVEQQNGTTLIGLDPAFGLNPDQKEGTRFSGPFAAIWYVVFMIPFFLWVRETPNASTGTVGQALTNLKATLKRIPSNRSLLNFLVSSMLFRDSLAALYVFGGTYAKLVLNWPITQVGIFGIVGALSAGIATWISGLIDQKRGPKPVIWVSIIVLICVCSIFAFMDRDSLFGMPLAAGSKVPDVLMYVCGAILGAAGGTLQASSRSMMVRHANPARPTETFGIYALAGKATAFMGTALVGVAAYATGETRYGIIPLIFLFIIALFLLRWVKPEGERAVEWSESLQP